MERETEPSPKTADEVAFLLWSVLRATTPENRATQLDVYAECRRAALGLGEFAPKP